MPLGEEGKPAFHLIKPGGIGRREVDVEARPCRQPGPHLGVFVCGVVVHDDVDVELIGHVSVDMLEEAQELLMTMGARHWVST